MDSSLALLTSLGSALTVGLLYYSLRTIRLFKRSVAARAWVYIALSAVFFSTGLTVFLVDSLIAGGLTVLGSAMMTVCGIFLLIGLRKNFLFWASNDHFT